MMRTIIICVDFHMYNKTQVVVFDGRYSMDCSQTLMWELTVHFSPTNVLVLFSILCGLYIQRLAHASLAPSGTNMKHITITITSLLILSETYSLCFAASLVK